MHSQKQTAVHAVSQGSGENGGEKAQSFACICSQVLYVTLTQREQTNLQPWL